MWRGSLESQRAREKVWIVVPAYNEAQVIGEVVAGLIACFNHVVVVDDGSVDRTGERARAAGATVLRHIINLGQGAALQTGIDYVLAQVSEFVATFDADGQHDPRDLVTMLERLEESGAHVALGSRFLGSAPGISMQRRMVLRVALLYQRMMSGVRLTDVHNGLRLIRREAAEKIRIRQNRMAHASEIVAEVLRCGLRIIEVPCVVRYTAYSKRKGQNLSGGLQIILDLAMRRLHK
jgi:polyprenyl-phospho-N-acetylgalactosaminyl synthase